GAVQRAATVHPRPPGPRPLPRDRHTATHLPESNGAMTLSVTIRITDAVKRYGDTTVIPDLSVEIGSGEFFTLLGPSGCGKTTLLRMIAGFNTVEAGDIHFNETRINDVEPSKRHIGMVFQNYAIFPHLSVRKN